jgi:ABC-type sugar transport system permease subunit/ABC-type glycerol-3-phosphate transport system substrate-binding protein
MLRAALICAVLGTTASAVATEPVTVRVFSLPKQRATAPAEIAAYRVMQRFLEKFPNIRLESATNLQIEGASMDAAPLMAIAGGTSPDIIYVNFRQSDTYIQQGFLYPLDEYLETLTPEERLRRIPAVIEPVVRREGPGGVVHTWAIPSRVLATVLFYRKDHFAAAGLDPRKPPQNWEEFAEYAEKLADPSRGRYAIGFGTDPNASYRMFPFLTSAGAEVVKKINGEWTATFNSDEAVTAFAFVDKLQKASVTRGGKTGPIAFRGVDSHQRWERGQISMMFGSLTAEDLGRHNPDLVAVAPVPRGPGGLSRAEVNAQMMGIFAGVKDKRVRDAAWEYIRFVGSMEAWKIFTDTMVQLGAGQLVDPGLLVEFGYAELAKLSPPGLRETFSTALRSGVPEPYGRNCQFIYNYVTKPLEEIYYTDFTGKSSEEIRAIIRQRLDEAVALTNEKMLGSVPPRERVVRDVIGWIAAIVALGGFAFFIRLVFRWMAPQRVAATDSHRNRLAVLFIAPAVLLILVWNYYPLVRGSLMAFQDYRLLLPSEWVGIRNFSDVIFDGRFWWSLKNAAVFCALWMLLGFLPPVALAVMVQEIPVGKIAFRFLFYIPAVVSGVVILFMWRAIYDPSPDGALNRILGVLGIPSQSWLQDPSLAMLCVVFPLAWAHLGPGSLIYLAALKGIPEELYEASDIDGAGFFSKLRGIVFPYLRPLLVINAVGATIFGFKSGDAVLAMTGGGPNFSTQVIGYEIWQRSFLYLRFGEATAMAWILGLMLMAFTAYQMRILARVEFRTANR